MREFIDFLHHLEKHQIPYDLNQTIDEYIMVNITSPNEKWEVDFSTDGKVLIEGFGNIGDVESPEILEYLYDQSLI